MESISPGSTIGILGDGQLGRMIAQAAAQLGYACHVYGTTHDSPTAQVCGAATISPSYTSVSALKRFAAAVDVITCEFENVPAETLNILSGFTVPVRPNGRAFAVAQDRIREKNFLNATHIPTTRWCAVTSSRDAREALHTLGPPLILKTVRMGYDGKGQIRVNSPDEAEAAWKTLKEDVLIAEAVVDFTEEISVIAARGLDGQMVFYPAVQNIHDKGILIRTTAPAQIRPDYAFAAEQFTRTIAERLDIIGLVAVEMFVTADDRLLVNEIAPRPHNSGHWTMDACYCSQFKQLVRAICGWPLGPTDRHSDAVMDNLLGEQARRWRELMVEDPSIKLHLYGKADVRPGRKMGHITRLFRPSP